MIPQTTHCMRCGKGGRMKQYCRYCAWMVVGDTNYCQQREETIKDSTAKSPNRCHDFTYNPIDAFGENEKGYQPRKPKKEQCDGQMSLF